MALAGCVGWRNVGGDLSALFAEQLAVFHKTAITHIVFPDALFAYTLASNTEKDPPRAREQTVLYFHGHLTNRESLTSALGLGAGAEKLSDNAYAQLALERWGAKALEQLQGAFALAFWEQRHRRLILGCDHMGARPLYYHQGNGWLAFASLPGYLLSIPGVVITPDTRRLANAAMRLTDEPERSFFEGIHRVPAASYIVFEGSKLIKVRYWQPDYSHRLHYARDEDYVEAARELLDRSVRSCLHGVAPVLAQITGGLDSSAIAATAARILTPAKVNTQTLVADEDSVLPPWAQNQHYLYEQPYVEAIARMYPNLRPSFLRGSPTHTWDDNWEDIFRQTGAPRLQPSSIAWFGPSFDHARSMGASTMLNGSTGNLTLSWDGRSGLTSMARAHQWRWVLREARALSRRSGQSVARLLWGQALKPNLPASVGSAIDRLRGKKPSVWAINPLNPDFGSELDIPERVAQQMSANQGGSSATRRLMFGITQQWNEMSGLMQYMTGIEHRRPFEDRSLIEFCFAVPDEQYLRNGVNRFLARRVLADRLPPEVIENHKRGIQNTDVFQRISRRRDAIVAGVEELARSSLVCRILDVPRMKALAERWPTDPATAGPEYHMVLYRGLHYGQFLLWVEGGAK